MYSVSRLAFTAMALGAALLSAACSQIQLTHQVAEHNRALELSGNQVILLNVVRASKGYPLYFNYLGDFEGKDAVTGSLQGAFAFGNHQILKHTGTPNMQFNNEISKFQVGNINSEEFWVSLSTPLTANNVAVFLNGDWPTEHLSMLVVRKIGINEKHFKSLGVNFETRCAPDRRAENDALCREVEIMIRTHGGKSDRGACRPPLPESRYEVKRDGKKDFAGKVLIFDNDPEDQCSFRWFQTAVRLLVLARPVIVAKSDKPDEQRVDGVGGTSAQPATRKNGQGRNASPPQVDGRGDPGGQAQRKVDGTVTKSEPAKLTITHVTTADKKSDSKETLYLRVEIMRPNGSIEIFDLPVGGNAGGVVGGAGAKVAATFFMLRSPADIIAYLGRLLRLQYDPSRRFTAKVIADRRHLLNLFVVNEGGPGGGAISVSHEGQRFVVPVNSYDPKERHMSLQSLMLVSQLLAMRVKRESLKGNPTLFVGQ